MDTSSVRWQLTDARDLVMRVHRRRWRWMLGLSGDDGAQLVETMAAVHACAGAVPAAHHETLQTLLEAVEGLDRGIGSAVSSQGRRLWRHRAVVAQVAELLGALVAELKAAAPDVEAVPRLEGSSGRRQRVRTERLSAASARAAG